VRLRGGSGTELLVFLDPFIRSNCWFQPLDWQFQPRRWVYQGPRSRAWCLDCDNYHRSSLSRDELHVSALTTEKKILVHMYRWPIMIDVMTSPRFNNLLTNRQNANSQHETTCSAVVWFLLLTRLVPGSKLRGSTFFCPLQLKILMCREWAETAVDPTSSCCQVQKPNMWRIWFIISCAKRYYLNYDDTKSNLWPLRFVITILHTKIESMTISFYCSVTFFHFRHNSLTQIFVTRNLWRKWTFRHGIHTILWPK
jgi:hypothetical protein